MAEQLPFGIFKYYRTVYTSKYLPIHETVGKSGFFKFLCFHILSDCGLSGLSFRQGIYDG